MIKHNNIFWASIFLSQVLILSSLPAQEVISLYPEGVPCYTQLEEVTEIGRRDEFRVLQVDKPELHAYFPPDSIATGTSIVICPGGGYQVLAWEWEGLSTAEWLAQKGITAFVLKYRLPDGQSDDCRSKIPLMDVQRALRTVRTNARKWNIQPDRIGILGFSAGGHLAASLLTHHDTGMYSSVTVDQASCRPDFGVLIYPVISTDTLIHHRGSINNLLGNSPEDYQLKYFSNERQVNANTPPTILIHAGDDRSVVPENSIRFYQALRKHGVSTALHLYQRGGHGFAFPEPKEEAYSWPTICLDWLKTNGYYMLED